jgi:hypothetical protein
MFPALEFALFRVMRPEDLLPAITIANGNRRSVRGMALFQRIFPRSSDLTIAYRSIEVEGDPLGRVFTNSSRSTKISGGCKTSAGLPWAALSVTCQHFKSIPLVPLSVCELRIVVFVNHLEQSASSGMDFASQALDHAHHRCLVWHISLLRSLTMRSPGAAFLGDPVEPHER